MPEFFDGVPTRVSVPRQFRQVIAARGDEAMPVTSTFCPGRFTGSGGEPLRARKGNDCRDQVVIIV